MANEYFRGTRKLKRRGVTNRETNQKKFPILLCIILIFKKKKKRRKQTIFLENHIRITRKKKKIGFTQPYNTKYLLYQAHFYKYCTIYIRPTVLKNAAHPNAIFYLQ